MRPAVLCVLLLLPSCWVPPPRVDRSCAADADCVVVRVKQCPCMEDCRVDEINRAAEADYNRWQEREPLFCPPPGVGCHWTECGQVTAFCDQGRCSAR